MLSVLEEPRAALCPAPLLHRFACCFTFASVGFLSYTYLHCHSAVSPLSLSLFSPPLLFPFVHCVFCFLVCRCAVEQPFCSLRCQFAWRSFLSLMHQTWLGLALAFQLTAFCFFASPFPCAPAQSVSPSWYLSPVDFIFLLPFRISTTLRSPAPAINLNQLRQKKAKIWLL